ncbi:MAG: PhoH family protein [Planctomycetota bacterium]|nr:PhoH family protein [Planctomycetota bacterium]
MELSIVLEQPQKAAELFGPSDRHLRMIRDALGVQIFARDGQVKVTGSARNVSRAAAVMETLQRAQRHHRPVTADQVAEAISGAAAADADHAGREMLDVYAAGHLVAARTAGQKRYIDALQEHDLVFCVGPAGTGKTYLAVAFAVHMLKHHRAKRLILARPAVEAGEKLGFLPGDMQAKVNPYLRPLFDALHDMMDYEQIRRFMVNDVIEVIPLAFMRGRTLNDSVIILDEAQNTTASQMLMFLTRMGHGSKMIVTGDDSQIDLEPGTTSGLDDARQRLNGIQGLSYMRLEKADIVRHRLVQNIVEAYERNGGAKRSPARPAGPGELPNPDAQNVE